MILIVILALLAQAPAHASGQLWHEWYLVTQNGVPMSLFEETAEKRTTEHELAITQKWVEKMAGRQETYIGSVSQAETLAPVAFFVERKGDKPYKIDGRAKGGELEITFKPGSPDLARSDEGATRNKQLEHTPIGPGYYLSSALGIAIARKFQDKKAQSFAFTAVVEDGGDMNVEVKKGKVDVGTAEKKIGKEHCRQATVEFAGKMQEWWLTKAGKACVVAIPESGVKMELSTEKAAKKALKEL